MTVMLMWVSVQLICALLAIAQYDFWIFLHQFLQKVVLSYMVYNKENIWFCLWDKLRKTIHALTHSENIL